MVYAINKNNKISELKAPKIVVTNDGKVVIQMIEDVYNKIKESNKTRMKKVSMIDDEYCLYFSLEDKDYRITIDDQLFQQEVNILLLGIASLEAKNKDGEYTSAGESEVTNKLDKQGAEVNTYLG